MRNHAASPLLLGLALVSALNPAWLGGCSREELAPDCFALNDVGKCTHRIPFAELHLECGTLPPAVEESNYEHVIGHEDLLELTDLEWSATGLPEGVFIEPGGVLRGKPLFQGTYDKIQITIRDPDRKLSRTTACGPIVVTAPLSIDLRQTRGCLGPGQLPGMFTSGGSGSPIECELLADEPENQSCRHGLGNGWMPTGIELGQDCQIRGQIDPNIPEWGTFVWIAKVKQDGAELYVPFCVEKPGSSAHNIRVVWNGQNHPVMDPMNIEFRPDARLSFGDTENPRIEVTATCQNETCNGRSVDLRGTCSPFDSSLEYALDPLDSVRNGSNAIIGFSHALSISTPRTVREYNLDTRPWVLNMRNQYCTSPYGQADKCNGPDSLRSRFTQSLIAWPPGNLPQ